MDTLVAQQSEYEIERGKNDLVDKADQYFAKGVKSCWIIIPSMGGVAIYSAPGKYEFFNEDDTAKDEVLGLEVPVSEIFM